MGNEYKFTKQTNAKIIIFNAVTTESDLCKEVSNLGFVEVSL